MSHGLAALLACVALHGASCEELLACPVQASSLIQRTLSQLPGNEPTWFNATLLQTSVAGRVRVWYAALSDHGLASFASNLLVFILLSLILGGLGISAAAYMAEKQRSEGAASNARSTVSFPTRRQRTAETLPMPSPSQKQGCVLSPPHSLRNPHYPALCPSLAEPRPRHMTCDFTVPLRGERQTHTWLILEQEEVLLKMRLDELEDNGMALEKPDGQLLGLVRTDRLHLAESHTRPPEIHSANDCLFAKVSKDEVLSGASMLLPDQMVSLSERYSLQDADSGQTQFRLQGSLQEQRLTVYDSMGHAAAVVYGEGPRRIIELLPGMDPAFMICAFFAVEKLRLVPKAAAGLHRRHGQI